MGSVIITGANGSIAARAAEYLFKNHSDLTAILTVRNPSSESDANTQALRDLIASYPNAKASIHALDLSSLDNVKTFADEFNKGVAEGKYPRIKAIICNAFYWNLLGHVNLTSDDYEMTFQVNHLAHAALVLRLLGSFVPEGGRVLNFTSDAIIPGKNMLEKIPPGIPEDMDILVKPTDEVDAAKGFQRYANSKLVVTSWTNALNRHLEKDPKLSTITAVVMNPGNISDSRALRTNTPGSLALMQRWVIQPLMPVFRALVDPTFRNSETAGSETMQLALGEVHGGERGYFTLLEKDETTAEAMDEGKQDRVWTKTLEWAKMTNNDTALSGAFA